MQCHGERVPLRGVVVQVPHDRADERVEIAGCARAGLAGRDGGQREVEEQRLPGAVGADPDRDVVRFDVAVPDALALQVVEGVEQVVAVALQVVHGEAALPSQDARHGLVPRGAVVALVVRLGLDVADVLGGQDRTPAHGERAGHQQPDDARVPQSAERLRLALQRLRLVVVERHLQHRERVALPLLFVEYEQGARRRAGAEAAAYPPTPLQQRAGRDLQRVEVVGGLLLPRLLVVQCGGGPKVLLDLCQHFQEVAHRVEPPVRLLGGGGVDQVVQERRDAVLDGRRGESLTALHAGLQLRAGRGGSAAGGEQIGERADAVHVHARRIGLRGGQLRRQVRVRGVVDAPVRHRGRRQAHTAGGDRTRSQLPVGDVRQGPPPALLLAQFMPCRALVAGDDMDGAWREGAVVEPLGVRVLDRLGDLADEREPVLQVQLPAPPVEELVQVQPLRMVVEGERRARVMVGGVIVPDAHHTGVVDPLQCVGLPLRRLKKRLARLAARIAGPQMDPYPHSLGQLLVSARVVGPGGTRVEGALVQDERADLRLPHHLLDADLGERPADIGAALG